MRDEYQAAIRIAEKNEATSPPYYIDDRWGGYWQCTTVHGPYNFRVGSITRALPEPMKTL